MTIVFNLTKDSLYNLRRDLAIKRLTANTATHFGQLDHWVQNIVSFHQTL